MQRMPVPRGDRSFEDAHNLADKHKTSRTDKHHSEHHRNTTECGELSGMRDASGGDAQVAAMVLKAAFLRPPNHWFHSTRIGRPS